MNTVIKFCVTIVTLLLLIAVTPPLPDASEPPASAVQLNHGVVAVQAGLWDWLTGARCKLTNKC